MKNANEVSFDKQLSGYNREQVDQYIGNLSAAYQSAYDEYTSVCEKYDKLLQDYVQMEAKEQDRPDADVVAKALIDAETLVQMKLAKSNEENEKTRIEAAAEAKRITLEASTALATAQIQAQQLIDDAAAEAEAKKAMIRKISEEAEINIAASRQVATKIIADAQQEAAKITLRAKTNLDQTNETIERSIHAMQALITAETTVEQTSREKDFLSLVPAENFGV
jgi:cell division septum initiation protein DivIVA